MKKLIGLLALFGWLYTSPAEAFYYSRTDCSSVTVPILGDVCAQLTTVSGRTAGRLYVYNGTTWVEFELTSNKNATGGYAGLSGGLLTATQVPGSHPHTTSAGAPAAGSCVRAGEIIIDTTNGIPYYCLEAAGNPFAFDDLGDNYNQFSDGTNSASAVGSETFKFEATATIVHTVTAGSPDKMTSALTTQFARKVVEILPFDPTTDVATGDGKAYFRVPTMLNGMNLVAVAANVITAGTTGTTDVQIARCVAAATGNVCSSTVVDMLSTKITIDSAENSTSTAATPAVINTSNDDVATGQILRINVDAVSTTAPKGLLVVMEFQLP